MSNPPSAGAPSPGQCGYAYVHEPTTNVYQYSYQCVPAVPPANVGTPSANIPPPGDCGWLYVYDPRVGYVVYQYSGSAQGNYMASTSPLPVASENPVSNPPSAGEPTPGQCGYEYVHERTTKVYQ